MPDSPHETLLCRYHYDPLDRQSGCTVPQQPVIQRFHCDGRLTTEIQGGTRWSILQHGDHLLAQRNHREASVTATLLATDQQRSVLNTLDATGPHPLAYSPYGHHPAVDRLLSLRGFNGEQPDPLTGHYHLGNGYRQFNPVLMRFNSPDSWSPFGEGGLNAYGYCEGDPTNRVDPDGHAFLKFIFKFVKKSGSIKLSRKSKAVARLNSAQLPEERTITSQKFAWHHDEVQRIERKFTVTSQQARMDGRKIHLERTISESPFNMKTTQRVYLNRNTTELTYGKRRITQVRIDEAHSNNYFNHMNTDKVNSEIGRLPNKDIERKLNEIRSVIEGDKMARYFDSQKFRQLL